MKKKKKKNVHVNDFGRETLGMGRNDAARKALQSSMSVITPLSACQILP